jgi:hypothetical protein
MSTEEALFQYVVLALAVFDKDDREDTIKNGTFKATMLKKGIKVLVSANALSHRIIRPPPASGPDNNNGSGCRDFDCAMPARNMAHPQRFRTYASCAHAGPDCLI